MATMVTPLAPVRAVKNAQATSAAMALPPGSQPAAASRKFIIRCGAPEAVSTHPTMVNSGKATRIGMVARRFISIKMVCTTMGSKSLLNRHTKESPAMEINNGVSNKVSTRIKMAAMIRNVTDLPPRQHAMSSKNVDKNARRPWRKKGESKWSATPGYRKGRSH